MAKQSLVTEIIKSFGGQNSSFPSGALEVGEAEQIRNFMVRKGRLRKLWGSTLYANLNIGGFGAVLWIDYFRRRWMVQHGDYIGYESGEASQDFALLGSILLGSANKIRSEKWRNNIYLVNGVENKFFSDTLGQDALLTVGLYPPDLGRRTGTALSVSTGTGTSTFVAGEKYQYVVTWYDAVREIESLPNGAVVDEAGFWSGKEAKEHEVVFNGDAILANITILKGRGYDTDRVTNWKLYRAPVDLVTGLPSDDFKLVLEFDGLAVNDGLIPIATDSVSDIGAALGTVLDESISPPPSGRYYLNGLDAGNYGPRFVRQHNDQLWLFGVRFPGIVDEGYAPTSGVAYASEVSNFDYWKYNYDIGYANDQKDTGLAKFRNTLIFCKEKSIYYLDGTAPTNYRIRELDAQRGIIAPGSIQETPVGVIGLSQDGFILIDSASPANLISEKIFDEFRKINQEQVDKINSSYDLQEGKYECHIPISPSDNLSRVFVYDINQRAWQFYTKRIGQASKYDLNSVGARVGLLGDPIQGKLYTLTDETQVTFVGQKIAGRWYSKQFDFGNTDQLKRLVSMRFKARAKVNFQIKVDVIMDEGQQQTWSTPWLDSESIYTTLAETVDDADGDELVLDEGALSDELVWKKFEVLLSGVARNFKVVIREEGETDDSSGFEIDEITFVANLMGR
jgi:hypothetical protein